MTLNQIRPAVGEQYRHRLTGRKARVRCYPPPSDGNTVRAVLDGGGEWLGTRQDFWAEFIHDDLYDLSRN